MVAFPDTIPLPYDGATRIQAGVAQIYIGGTWHPITAGGPAPAGGPFLPLRGGTLQGDVDFAGHEAQNARLDGGNW